MYREQITELLAQYEESHAVEKYEAYDWHVWPALRILAGMALFIQKPLTNESLDGKTRVIMRFGLAFLRMLSLRRHEKSYPGVEKSDIAILTNGNRALKSGEFFYHSVVDPFLEMVSREGRACTVWELCDEPKLPRRVHHAFIRSPRFNEERLVHAFLVRLKPLKPPEWFGEYSAWWVSHVGGTVSWNKVRRYLMGIEVWSRLFKKWLRKSGCSALIVDCWYDQHTMGATLAASRLGLWSMDIQHGLQGAGHFAYSSWMKMPEGGYEVMPDGFWVWGKEDAETLVKFNKGVLSAGNVLVGGNLWLNMWRTGNDDNTKVDIEKARALTKGYKKTILITLQKGIPYGNDIFPVIQNSPRDWLWLIRVHRQELSHGKMKMLEAEFRGLGHPGVNLREATSLPLYALFRACDCHMTWFSTCAIEALAFGVPSIILHPSGAHTFKRHIEAGVMCYCDDHNKTMELVELCGAISTEACLNQANSAFASSEESRVAVDKLIEHVDAYRN